MPRHLRTPTERPINRGSLRCGAHTTPWASCRQCDPLSLGIIKRRVPEFCHYVHKVFVKLLSSCKLFLDHSPRRTCPAARAWLTLQADPVSAPREVHLACALAPLEVDQ